MSPKLTDMTGIGRVEADLAAHVAESAGRRGCGRAGRGSSERDRQAEEAGHDLGEVAAVVVDEDVEPAVVVVVPEQAGEAVRRPGDAELGGDVEEGAVAVVAVEPAGPSMFETKRSSRPSSS